MSRTLAIALVLAAPTAARAEDATTAAATVDEPAVVASTPITGAIRTSIYADADQTIVWRALAMISGGIGHWILSGSATADVVSSASVDVRTSPLAKVSTLYYRLAVPGHAKRGDETRVDAWLEYPALKASLDESREQSILPLTS